ncbi:hypothetical protein QBC35DRAFT_395231 [Podospora australis]|uniref:Uncharacterized protein n=1 Tax=Podospora australis TaxID=1536484 RepID=A0AAN6WMD8_9PEZI|nr:hypothetical protein QBC35DRAFT_395231 [Podospora australis]
MKSTHLLTLTSAALIQAQTSYYTFFLPDSEPLSLDASVVEVRTAFQTIPDATVETFQVSCPTAISPDNDACRAAGIYPAEVYHTHGTIWGGTTTYSVDDSTTAWECKLSDSGAKCAKTVEKSGVKTTVSQDYDECGMIAHRLPLVVTAGLEKMPKEWFLQGMPSLLNEIYRSELEEGKCPVTKAVMFAGAVDAATITKAPARTTGTGTGTGTNGEEGETKATSTSTSGGMGKRASLGIAVVGVLGAVLL